MGLFDFLKNKQKKNVSKMNTNEGIKNHSEVTDRISVTTTALPNENNINKIYSMKIDNLFIGEIILLDWLEEKLTVATPPGYFAYTYGINHNNSIKLLKKEGLIRISAPSESLVGLKVTDLKQILSKNNLKVTGKKADLIQRIMDNLDEDIYSDKVKPVWKKTNSGIYICDKYQLLIWGHKNGQENSAVNPATLLPFIDDSKTNEAIALSLSEISFRSNMKELNYGLASNDLRYQIRLKVNSEIYDEALDLLIGCAILEFTGIQNAGHGYIYFWENHNYLITLKPNFIEYQSKLNLSSPDILERADLIFDVYEPNLSKIRLYKNKNEFLLALKILLDGTHEELNSLFSEWYNRAPNNYKL